MRLPLRLALVPVGIALAARGLQALTDEADRLDREIDARRAALGILDPGQPEADAGQADTADPWAELERPPRRRGRRDVGRLVAAAVGFGVGAYLATRAHRALRDRAAAELGGYHVQPVSDDVAAELHAQQVKLAAEHRAAPVATEPGCTHPGCIMVHPHAGPAVLDYPCPDDCTCKQ